MCWGSADATQPLFVNLVTIIGPKRTSARPGDRARIAGGQVKVVRYPPRLKGWPASRHPPDRPAAA